MKIAIRHLTRIRASARAALLHFVASAMIGALVAGLVFGLWFPDPFRQLAGGAHLFLVLIAVDLVCGPLLTFVVFNPAKSRRELRLDMSLIVLIQLAALAYGLYSVAIARPVVLAFEVDRFVVVSAAQIDDDSMNKTMSEKYDLAWWKGPVLVGTREPLNNNEMFKSVEQSLQGVEPSARPSWWQSYSASVPRVKKAMKPISSLIAHLSKTDRSALEQRIFATQKNTERLFYLPLTSKKELDSWIVLLDVEAQIIGYAPVGGF